MAGYARKKQRLRRGKYKYPFYAQDKEDHIFTQLTHGQVAALEIHHASWQVMQYYIIYSS
jgi:hypothetical protein